MLNINSITQPIGVNTKNAHAAKKYEIAASANSRKRSKALGTAINNTIEKTAYSIK